MSSTGPHETEAKFRLEDRAAFEARLRALGAEGGPVEDEENVLLDDAAGTLTARGMALRVRTVAGRALLTLKGPKEVRGGVKTRLELETGVEDAGALVSLLGLLGFSPSFRYQKRRATWTFADPVRPVVVVDETPLGLFAEIEGEEAAVRALASELGVPEGAFLADSYVALYVAARRADPALPRDMVFR